MWTTALAEASETAGKVTTDGETDGIKYQLRESNVDDYTEAEYNKFGWARVNGVLDGSELRTFYERISDRKNGAYAPKTADGKYIFAVGEKFGVNNTVIVTDGRYANPSIERVYRINLDNETDIEIVRDIIYEREQQDGARTRDVIETYFDPEVVKGYGRYDYANYEEQLKKPRANRIPNKHDYRFEQDGSGDNGEVEQTVKPQLRTNPETDDSRNYPIMKCSEELPSSSV